VTAVYDSLVRISRNAKQRQQMGTLASDKQQRDSNERGILGLGGRVGNVYEALDVSGGDVFGHPRWLEALARVEAGQSAGVSVAFIDRYGRDVAKGMTYADRLMDAGGTIVVDGTAYDLTDPNQRLMFVMTLGLAEHYRLTGKKKSRETMDMVQRRGITNRVPYGYERNRRPDGTLHLPGEDQKKLVPGGARLIVHKVFEMRAGGARWSHIIDWLHEQGIDSPSGNPWWTSSTLRALITNRVYVGEVHMGGHVTKAAHEAIVTEAEWKAAQSTAVVVRTGKNLPGVAHGLLVCTGCRNPLSVQRAGHGQTFYGCRRHSSAGPCPRPVNGAQDAIDAYVHEKVLERLALKRPWSVVRRWRNLADAKEALDRAVYDRDQFLLGTEGLAADVIKAGADLREAAVQAATSVYEEAHQAADAATMTAGLTADAFDKADLPKRQKVARAVIDRIELNPFPKGGSKRTSKTVDRLDIQWKD
jgi:DNA invertase Pin-like site-specific DNA recombinase